MKKITASQQKLLKVIHLIVVSLWMTSAIFVTVLPFVAKSFGSADEIHTFNILYHFIDMSVLTILLGAYLFSTYKPWENINSK